MKNEYSAVVHVIIDHRHLLNRVRYFVLNISVKGSMLLFSLLSTIWRVVLFLLEFFVFSFLLNATYCLRHIV